MNERKPKQVEDCLVFPDGSKKWFTIRTIPVPDGIFIHSNEFTKRKKYEEDLLRYQSVLNQAEKMAHLGSWWINIDNLNDINSNKLGWSDEVFRIFGFEPNSVEVTNDLFFSLVHPDDRQRIVEQFSTSLSNKKPYSIEHRIIRPDGTERIVFEHAEFSLDKNGDVNCVLGAVQDITESKKAVKHLEYSLHEKENLLRELFHRTKNNMQVISSLLTLKAAEVNDQRTTGVLEDMNNRILAISLVHQKLYQSKNLSRVNIKDYITDLVELLKSSHLIRTQKIEFRLNIEEVNILFDTAVPCGLIINELISNSLKYAFPRNRKGCIEVSFTRKENDLLELTISDNGIGIHEDVSEDRYNLGLRLFHIFAEDQLQAEVNLDNSKGISWTIRFKDILYHERV